MTRPPSAVRMVVIIGSVLVCLWTALGIAYTPLAMLGQLADTGNPQAYVTTVLWADAAGLLGSTAVIAANVCRRRLHVGYQLALVAGSLVLLAGVWIRVGHTPG